MEFRCLLVDLDNENLPNWQNQINSSALPIAAQASINIQDAQVQLRQRTYNACVLFAKRPSTKELHVLKTFFEASFALPSLVLIICDIPSPQFLSDTFEYGIENFGLSTHWVHELQKFSAAIKANLSDPTSAESRALKAFQAIQNPKQMSEILSELKMEAEHDYLVAYVLGIFLSVQGAYEDAIEALRKAIILNPFFIPAKTKLADALLILGKSEEAIAILLELEKLNDKNAERKIALANAQTEQGLTEASLQSLEAAQKIDPTNRGIIEAKIHILLKNHKYNEAVALIDELEEVGPHLASKLNDLGVKLSKAGKGKSAIVLYQKAHKLVRTELKYKISINSALAEFRMGSYQKALAYINRSEQEYGSTFAKAASIRAKIQEALKA